MNATSQSAITRPRISGAEVSCSVALPRAINDTLAAPTATSNSSAAAAEGASAVASTRTPNSTEERTSVRVPVRPRAAVYSPPMTAPSPIAAVMKP